MLNDQIPLSKSISIRNAFLAQNHEQLASIVESCDDVLEAKSVMSRFLSDQKLFNVNASATVFRFLCVYLMSKKGKFCIQMGSQLGRRNHDFIRQIAEIFQAEYIWRNNECIIEGGGYSLSQLSVDWTPEITSQPLSALLLWSARNNVVLELSNSEQQHLSYSYFMLTVNLIMKYGIQIVSKEKNLILDPIKFNVSKYYTEFDVSSYVSSCLYRLTFEDVIIDDHYILGSIQAEARIWGQILMALVVERVGYGYLNVKKIEGCKFELEFNLSQAIDIFPVLVATICLSSQSITKISGIEALVHKESNRLLETLKLIEPFKEYYFKSGVLFIEDKKVNLKSSYWKRDHVEDHRMVMAAMCVEKICSQKFSNLSKKALSKSFSNFGEVR